MGPKGPSEIVEVEAGNDDADAGIGEPVADVDDFRVEELDLVDDHHLGPAVEIVDVAFDVFGALDGMAVWRRASWLTTSVVPCRSSRSGLMRQTAAWRWRRGACDVAVPRSCRRTWGP